MEPVAIGEGGRNWGQAQRVGKTTFSTVILRRGVTTTRHLWKWFDTVARAGGYKHRMAVVVRMYGPEPAGDGERPYIEWKLERALPVKLKLADLDATGQEVAVEELHLVHEGIVETASTGGGS
jgi:phage tail-like protein